MNEKLQLKGEERNSRNHVEELDNVTRLSVTQLALGPKITCRTSKIRKISAVSSIVTFEENTNGWVNEYDDSNSSVLLFVAGFLPINHSSV